MANNFNAKPTACCYKARRLKAFKCFVVVLTSKQSWSPVYCRIIIIPSHLSNATVRLGSSKTIRRNNMVLLVQAKLYVLNM
uniref:Uncharacterized protein n=1 Tax=Romanomermis culicivorax TaxID=13658 RepID=A0A915IA81_ROMCU